MGSLGPGRDHAYTTTLPTNFPAYGCGNQYITLLGPTLVCHKEKLRPSRR